MDPEVMKAFEEAMREVQQDLREVVAGTARELPPAEYEALGAARVVNPRLASAKVFEQLAMLEGDIAAVRELTIVQVQRLDQARTAAQRAKDLVVEALTPHVGDEVRLTTPISWVDSENISWTTRAGARGTVISVSPEGEAEIRLNRAIAAPFALSPVARGRQWLDTLRATTEQFEVLKRAPGEVVGMEGLTPSEILAVRGVAEGKAGGPQAREVMRSLQAKGVIDASGNLTEKGVSALPSWMKR